MYTLGSAEFNQIIETPNNKAIKSRLVLLDDNTIIDKIKSLILYSASCSQELQIGTTNMAYIDAEVESNLILTNREARFECGVELSDGTVEYIPMGVFTIQKPQGDIDFVKFTANDRMQKFDYPYSSTLTYPTTDKAMLEELATMCGVTLATNIDNPITIDKALDGYTRREVLGYIAGLHGKFACFNRNGELELKWYNTDTPITKNIGLIWGFEKSDEDFTVSKIEVAKNNETTLTSGNGYGVVQHSNPLATQEIVNDLFTSLNGFTYNASVVDILDDIRLDLGDVIKVTYLDGKDYLVPCMSIKQDFGQGSTNIESFAKSDTENTYRFTGPTIQYLNRMAMELLVANRVIATKVDAEYVQSHAITTDNLDAIKADIQELIVDEIDGKYADIHLANIDIADIGTFFADSGLLKDVTVVDGHITGELDAVRINADVITTGTLSVDRLLVTGKDSIVYQINVDSSGLSETELEKEVYQKYLNGTDIVANSITATQLNVSQIFADKTVTSTLFAQDITATGTITGAKLVGADAEITSGSIGGFDIKNNFLGFKESSSYLDINTNEEKMSHWYSFKIKPQSYNDAFASTTKVFWVGSHPHIVGSGIDDDGFYSEDSLIYPLYITANGKIVSNGETLTTIFGSGHNYTLNPASWGWRDSATLVTGIEKTELGAGYFTLNELVKFSGKGFDYQDTNVLAFNTDGIYSPKINAENLAVKERISSTELITTDITVGSGGVYSNGDVTVLGNIKTVSVLGGSADLTVGGETTLNGNTTVKGQLVTEQGSYVSDLNGEYWGSEGYVVLVRMEITVAWMSAADIEFDILGINQSGKVLFRFNNPSVATDTRVELFTQDISLSPMYYTLTVGADRVTIDLIGQKPKWGSYRIINTRATSHVFNRAIITLPNTFESVLRNGAVAATMSTKHVGAVCAINDLIARFGTDQQASLATLWDMVTLFPPYKLTDIDNPRQGIGLGILGSPGGDSTLYLSFTFSWITIQFAADSNYIYARKYYGNNGWSDWAFIR